MTQRTTDETPQTKTDSYRGIKEAGDDVSLRRKVAASIAMDPATTSELSSRFDHSSNALRPRVNELVRMGCVERSGTRENPSGHEAYVHWITHTGKMYLWGECDPDPAPTLSDLQGDVVDIARAFCAGNADRNALESVVKEHDGARLRRDPDWTPEYLLETDDTPEPTAATDGGCIDGSVDGKMNSESGGNDALDAPATVPKADDEQRGLTEDELEQIKEDPVLEVSDFVDDGTELTYSEGGE